MTSHPPPNIELEYVWNYLLESLPHLAFRHPPG